MVCLGQTAGFSEVLYRQILLFLKRDRFYFIYFWGGDNRPEKGHVREIAVLFLVARNDGQVLHTSGNGNEGVWLISRKF